MASVKIALRRKKNAQGMYPLTIRITKNRKSSFIYTGQYIDEKDFDSVKRRVKKSHPNSVRLNNLLLKKLAEANEKLLELQDVSEHSSAQVVKQHVAKQNTPADFFTVADQYLTDLLKANKHSRYSSDKPRVNHLRRFNNNKPLPFHEMTPEMLKRFQTHLVNVRGMNQRSAVNTLVVIRTIFNIAIRENITERKYYPFGKGKIVIKFPESVKLGLALEEVKQLEQLNYEEHSPTWHALNAWLLSFYFAGMRVSDVLRLSWDDFRNERLHYRMGKNSKVLSLKIPHKAKAIMHHYESDKRSATDFIFPELKQCNISNEKEAFLKAKAANKKFNKYLAQVAKDIELDKQLTMHIARHTFANISSDKIPIQMLQKLYRHSSLTTTINYQKNFIFKDADEALDAVIDF